MAQATCNGFPVIDLTLSMPVYGTWHADLSVDSSVAIQGSVEILFGSQRFSGTCIRGTLRDGRVNLLAVGGANKLSQQLSARYYQNVPVSIPIRDLLTESGETIDASSAPGSLFMLKWARLTGPAIRCLKGLLEIADLQWRILDSGSVLIQSETAVWPESSVTGRILSIDGVGGKAQIETDEPSLRPGTTWSSMRLDYVQHRMHQGVFSTEVMFS